MRPAIFEYYPYSQCRRVWQRGRESKTNRHKANKKAGEAESGGFGQAKCNKRQHHSVALLSNDSVHPRPGTAVTLSLSERRSLSADFRPVAVRTDKGRLGCPNGMCLTTMTRRSVSIRSMSPGTFGVTDSAGLFFRYLFGQVRLRGEVHRLIAPRDQKYQSNFVEVCAVAACTV